MFGLSAIENEDYSTADALMEYKDHSVDHISLEDEVFMNPKLFSLKETALWKKISDELRKRKEKMIMKRKELESEIKTPTFIRKKDKYAFTIGVILTVCTTLIAARFSYLLPPFYLFWAITLLSARFVMYHMQHYHYFMLDFCYFSNLLLMFYLYMYPTSPHLFLLNFANANGPLLWAIVTWKNSLVFHDVDKITSVFIHALPPIVTFVIKNFPEASKYVSYQTCIDSECSVSFGQMIIPHLLFFAFWQLCYYLKTEVIDRDHIKRDTNIITSFRFMKQYKGSPVYKILNKYAEKYQLFIFMTLQFTYHLLTIIPVKLMYDYPTLHFIAMGYVFVQCVHNGSNFYIEKFSSSYIQRLQEIANSLEGIDTKNGESSTSNHYSSDQ